MLHSRGWPTSLVLLFRVEVAELALPLSCHPSLGLHDLFRLVGAAGRLVALSRVKVVQVGARRAGRAVEVVDRVRSGTGAMRHSSVCWRGARVSRRMGNTPR